VDYGLSGVRALVTGASRGIGRAVAGVLAREGADVALCARGAEALGAVAAELAGRGARAVAVPADLALDGAAPRVLEGARAGLGGEIQVLVACHASITPMAKLYSLGPDAIRSALAADLGSTLVLLSAALPGMMAARFGRVVLVGSASAQLGQGKAPLYCATKAALEGLVRNLAIDYTRFGVTANLVAPGFVDTERLRARADEAARQRLREATSARELARPEEVAEVVAFLCSRAAGYVSGAVVPVTGGAHLANLW
jgi:3-oxoacyl-[acyl-carrier protein] reductase